MIVKGDDKMVKANDKEDESEIKGVPPKDYTTLTKELWDEYTGLHYIDPVKRVNEPRKRDKRVKKHRVKLEGIIAKELGDNDSFESMEEKEALEMSSNIVTKLVYEYEKSVNPGIEHEQLKKQVNEKRIRTVLKEAGIESYEELLKNMMDSEDLSYDKLAQDSPLRRLIDYVALSKDKDGLRIQDLHRSLSDIKHFNKLRELAGEHLGPAYNESASPTHIFQDFGLHVQSQDLAYAKQRKTTYRSPTSHDRKKGKGKIIDAKDKFIPQGTYTAEPKYDKKAA